MTPSAEPTSQRTEAAPYLVPVGLLQDGEIVILAIKPSGWFVLVASLPVLASALVVSGVALAIDFYHPATHQGLIWSLCAAGALGRMVAACWQWLGRTYVLTNRRAVSVRGLLRVHWTGAELARVTQAALSASLVERVLGTGSIYCLVGSLQAPAVGWQTVGRPAEVLEIVQDAVRRARRPGPPGIVTRDSE